MVQASIQAVAGPSCWSDRLGAGRCWGTFGELAQGMIQQEHFLVTFPIRWHSNATFRVDHRLKEVEHAEGCAKAAQAANLLIRHLGLPGGRLSIEREIPIGKGMASSSADIVAALRATAGAFGLTLSPELTSQLAVAVEPTDGVMYDEVVAYNHRTGQLLERLGPPPPLRVIGLDLGGTVDTIAFNQRPKAYTAYELELLSEVYEATCAAMRTGDLHLLGEATTQSARVNQRLLPKPHLEAVIQIAKQEEALGVSIAHSGTVIGVLLDNRRPDVAMQEAEIRVRLTDLNAGQLLAIPC